MGLFNRKAQQNQKLKQLSDERPAVLAQAVHTERTFNFGTAKVIVDDRDGRDTEYTLYDSKDGYHSIRIGESQLDDLITLLLKLRGPSKAAAKKVAVTDAPTEHQGQ